MLAPLQILKVCDKSPPLNPSEEIFSKFCAIYQGFFADRLLGQQRLNRYWMKTRKLPCGQQTSARDFHTAGLPSLLLIILEGRHHVLATTEP